MAGEDYEHGLELARRGEFFQAHEAFEAVWRRAEAGERDFYQGLVHTVVAWLQAERQNEVGSERQLEKARRRLTPYAGWWPRSSPASCGNRISGEVRYPAAHGVPRRCY